MQFQTLHKTIVNCTKCELREQCERVVPGIGPVNSKLFIIGEAPGFNEHKVGEPFVGRSGELLTQLLYSVGIDRDYVYITNTVKCWPHKGRKNLPPPKYAIDACKQWLWDEIKTVQPNVIVAFGLIPARTLLKLKHKIKMRDIVGHTIQKDYLPCPVVPCYHPSYLMQHGRKYVKDTQKHLKIVRGLLHES